MQDRVLDRDAGAVASDLDEPRQVVGHVDADEARCGLDPVGRDDANVQGQRRAEAGTGRPPDSDRCQERLDLAPEALPSAIAARGPCTRPPRRCECPPRQERDAARRTTSASCAACRARARTRIIRQCPSGRPSVGKPPSDCRLDLCQTGRRHVPRTNSSRFEATIPQSFTRSSSGTSLSAASSSTRWSKSSQRELAVEEARSPLGRIARDGARARRLACHRDDYGRSSSMRLTPCGVPAIFSRR